MLTAQNAATTSQWPEILRRSGGSLIFSLKAKESPNKGAGIGFVRVRVERFQGLLWLLAFDIGLALLAGIALDRRRPAGLGEYLLLGVHQILAIGPVLDALCVVHPFCEQIRAPGHFQPYTGL